MVRLTLARRGLAVAAAAAVALGPAALAHAESDGFELVPDTAVLLAQTSGGGNGGNTSSTTSATTIFSPASYVDYKRSGGEPTTTVDRYPFVPGANGFGATSVTYRDLVYVSNPLGIGFPGYSEFFKSIDLGQTFRVPPHDPVFAMPDGTSGGGGGDSHQAVGTVTHSVFFIDLSGACVTMNVSRDLGETFVSDRLGCGASPGAIDDRQWVDTDETASTPNVYVSFNNDSDPRGASLVAVRSQHDGAAGSFVTDSPCNAFSQSFAPADDATPTACPDPSDPQLWISGASWTSSPRPGSGTPSTSRSSAPTGRTSRCGWPSPATREPPGPATTSPTSGPTTRRTSSRT